MTQVGWVCGVWISMDLDPSPKDPPKPKNPQKALSLSTKARDGDAGDGDSTVVAQVVLLVRVEASHGPKFVFERMVFGGKATACGARSLFC